MILNILFVLILANAYMSVQIMDVKYSQFLKYNSDSKLTVEPRYVEGTRQLDLLQWELNGELNSGWWQLKTNQWNYKAHSNDGPWGTITHGSYYLSENANQDADLTTYTGSYIGLTYVKIPMQNNGNEYGFHIKKNINGFIKCLQMYQKWYNYYDYYLSFDDCSQTEDCANGQNCVLGEKVWKEKEVWLVRDGSSGNF